nr:immunoglobulin heavy chain junction region [Mus musculus]
CAPLTTVVPYFDYW